MEKVIYKIKPYVLLNDGTNGDGKCVLSSGTFDEMKKNHALYYNNSKHIILQIRKNELYLSDNTKIDQFEKNYAPVNEFPLLITG